MFNKLSFTLLVDKRPEGAPQVFSMEVSAGATDIDALKITAMMMELYGADNVTLMRSTTLTSPVEVAHKPRIEGDAT